MREIYSLSQSVATIDWAEGSVNSDGTVNAPLYKVGTGICNNVGSALSALNTSITCRASIKVSRRRAVVGWQHKRIQRLNTEATARLPIWRRAPDRERFRRR